jgi:3-deoxy-D-manno-octulosonic-acid transferase
VPAIIANARMSERSFKAYRPIAPLVRITMATIDHVAAQSEADAARYRKLGHRPSACTHRQPQYDLPLEAELPEQGRQWRARWGASRRVWIAASTHPDEEAAVLQAHRAVLARCPDALLLWAPRHPERFVAVAVASARAGFRVNTRRGDGLPDRETEVFVIDTLANCWPSTPAADVAFVGGSLQEIGGHNLLEPAAFGVPAPGRPAHLQLSRDHATAARYRHRAAHQRRREPRREVVRAAAAAGRKKRRGEAGRLRIERERGALARTLRLVESCLDYSASRSTASSAASASATR